MQETEEKYASLMNCPVKAFSRVYDTAISHNVQFIITRIDGHNLDSIRNYHLKFKSNADYELFKQLVSLGFGLEL